MSVEQDRVRPFDRLLEVEVEVGAPPAVVWELVRDPRRMAEWSPQVRTSELLDGAEEVALGTRFRNVNVEGEDLEWTTHGEVVRLEPERVVAFRIEENWAVWSLTLEPSPGGTRLVERREAPDGLSELALDLTDAFMGGQRVFTERLREGMRETLERIRAAAMERTAGRSDG
jgi:uncharacterized protein YndB with AHSA1/START domain